MLNSWWTDEHLLKVYTKFGPCCCPHILWKEFTMIMINYRLSEINPFLKWHMWSQDYFCMKSNEFRWTSRDVRNSKPISCIHVLVLDDVIISVSTLWKRNFNFLGWKWLFVGRFWIHPICPFIWPHPGQSFWCCLHFQATLKENSSTSEVLKENTEDCTSFCFMVISLEVTKIPKICISNVTIDSIADTRFWPALHLNVRL